MAADVKVKIKPRIKLFSHQFAIFLYKAKPTYFGNNGRKKMLLKFQSNI